MEYQIHKFERYDHDSHFHHMVTVQHPFGVRPGYNLRNRICINPVVNIIDERLESITQLSPPTLLPYLPLPIPPIPE